MKRPVATAFLSCWLLLGVGVACSTPPSGPPAPSLPDVILPDNPSPPPPPPPTPGGATKLPAGVLYVIRSKSPLIVLCSPDGALKLTADAGPMKVMARFVDAPDRIESRTFAEKYLYFAEVGAGGLCELIVIPAGATDAKSIIRRLIDAGTAPQPPPGPTPPIPVPPSDPLAQAVATAYAAETDAAKAQQVQELAALYRVAATSTVNDQALKTNGDLIAKMHAAAVALVGEAALPKVRRALGDYLNSKIDRTPTAAIQREVFGQAFATIATVLEGLK